MTQPPYSPDLATWDFFILQKLEKPIKERSFAGKVQTRNRMLEMLRG